MAIYTALSADRVENLKKYLNQVRTFDGDIAEFGVFKGGSLQIIAEETRLDTQIYGLDSFEGLPVPDKNYDLTTWNICEGGMKADFDTVEYALSGYHNVKLFKGWFPEVTKNLPNNVKFKFVHIDVDLYQSVFAACVYFYPRVVKNGVMIFDDYGWGDTPGAKKAIHKYFGELNFEHLPQKRIELCWANGSTQFQYLVVK